MPNFGRRGSRVNQSNQKRCWSTALQKLLLQSFTVEAQRVGRARSPLRAGVTRADPASRLESWRPRLYGRGYDARDPLGCKERLLRSTHLDGTAAKMAARQICPKGRRVGRARGPLRAGVARADPVFRLESGAPHSYERGYELLVCEVLL